MKHLKSFFATLVLLLSCISASAEDFKVDGIYYNITDSEKLTVEVTYRGYYHDSYSNEYTGDEVIPETVTYESKTYAVTSIGVNAFRDCYGLTSIDIPNCVTSIGLYAFRDCYRLTSITISEGVTSIGNEAFYGCSSLTSVIIPDSVTSIGRSAFDGTAWYNNQPDGVVYAGKVAYKYKGTMPSNTSIELAEGTLGIAGDAFHKCISLTSITIPEGVTSISNAAFFGCSSLTSITIPNSVTSIGRSAFENCSSLASITIPNCVTSIGLYAFDGTAWYNNQPDGVIYAGKVAYKYKGTMPSNTSIELAEGTLGIGDYAFYECSSLTSVTIPNSVTSIGYSAFWDCN